MCSQDEKDHSDQKQTRGDPIPVFGIMQESLLGRKGAFRLGSLKVRLSSKFCFEKVVLAMELRVREISLAAKGRAAKGCVSFE